MTEAAAKALFDSDWWIRLPAKDIVSFQLFEERLCMPFDKFHDAVELALGYPVWTHQFANPEPLKEDFKRKYPDVE